MKLQRFSLFGLGCFVFALAMTLLPVFSIPNDIAPELANAYENTTVASLVLLWLTALAYLVPSLQKILRGMVRLPSLLVGVWGMSLVLVLVVWVLTFQPAVGMALTGREAYWLVGAGVWALFFWGAGLSAEARAQFSQRAKWGVGVALTVITLGLTIIGAELGLRYALVLSDNFAFSKMHQNWVRLYWNPINDYGYRDYAPPSGDGLERTNIIVMGDSLVTGYGVNSIGDTFPHQLGRALGDDATVNIVAQPGWGMASALGGVENYPVEPDVLIVSHYLNDIVEGDARNAYDVPFPQIRVNPPESWAWWVENSAIVNFYYYRLYHYFEVDSTTSYFDWTLGAYDNADVWNAYQEELGRIVAYAEERAIDLYVVVWANLADVAGTAQYSAQVADTFRRANVPVVDMGQVLADYDRAVLVANAFDSHPSAYAHQRASDALLALMGE
jgi:hypothetical protein